MKFIRSGRNNPCPVCYRTKDRDCSWTVDQGLVLCHNNFNHENSTRFGYVLAKQEYRYVGPTKDGRCGKYVKEVVKEKIKQEKIRFSFRTAASTTRTWIYTDKNGNPLVAVRRIDTPEGKNIIQGRYDPEKRDFVFGKGVVADAPEIRSQITILYYRQVQEAIRNNVPIFWVEGEKAADALRSLGFVATTSIGGSKGFRNYGDYRGQLLGADLVICPDQDKPGLEYADQVEEFFQTEAARIRWLYAFPYSQGWKNLDQAQGLDVADWIEAGADQELILDSITEKRNLVQEFHLQQIQQKYNQISAEIRLIEKNLDHPGEKILAYADLQRRFALQTKDLQTIQGLQPALQKIAPVPFIEFCQKVDDDIDWLVEDMIPRSHNIILAGQPGSGKSLLIYDLIYCILYGQPWLNRFPVKRGKVLFVQLEEGEGYVPKSRALNRGIKEDETNLVMLFSATAADIPSIISFCDEQNIDLCVIDSLTALNGSKVEFENQAAYALPIQLLTIASAQMPTTFITIHHTRKAGQNDRADNDSIDEVRGNSAIVANAQSVILFKKYPREGEMARSIKYVKSRVKVNYSKHIIKFNPNNSSYNYLGIVSEGKVESDENDEEIFAPGQEFIERGLLYKNRVKEFMLSSNNRMELKEICHELNMRQEHVQSYLFHLEQEGIVIKERVNGRVLWRGVKTLEAS